MYSKVGEDAALAKDAPHQLLRNNPTKLRTCYAARRSSSGESGYVQVTVAVLLSAP
jgi:hypothetical protein